LTEWESRTRVRFPPPPPFFKVTSSGVALFFVEIYLVPGAVLFFLKNYLVSLVCISGAAPLFIKLDAARLKLTTSFYYDKIIITSQVDEEGGCPKITH